MPGTVVIFGAGATKACGGPLTSEILPRAFERQTAIDRERFLPLVDDFLRKNFHLVAEPAQRRVEDYPPLPLLLSLLDMAIDRRQSLGREWSTGRLEEVRNALEYIIFAVLTHELSEIGDPAIANKSDHYSRFLQTLPAHDELSVISLNYDIIVDNALMALTEAFPDYGCDISTSIYNTSPRRVPLYKLHGSLNWLHYPCCQRLDLGVSQGGRRTIKVLDELFQEQSRTVGTLEHRYTCQGSPCADPRCETPVRPVMITPTHMKDYRNPHIARIWYGAAQALRKADRVHIIGYSLPRDDVDVVYLLKRNMLDVAPERITIVEYDAQRRSLSEHEVGSRYRGLFGDRINWVTDGFESYQRSFDRAVDLP
jgi:hypothetical protein